MISERTPVILRAGSVLVTFRIRSRVVQVAPHPGGVGPMTRAVLLANVVETAERAVAG